MCICIYVCIYVCMYVSIYLSIQIYEIVSVERVRVHAPACTDRGQTRQSPQSPTHDDAQGLG